jgi:UrcA family protein
MNRYTLSATLFATSLGGAAAFGLATSGQAQPYYDGPGYSQAYDTAGDVVVHAPRYRQEHTFSGAPIVWARTSRMVDYSDLDLSKGWGVRALHNRVERAAVDACNALDDLRVQGLYSMEDPSNADCINRAVDDAMSRAPIRYVNYRY